MPSKDNQSSRRRFADKSSNSPLLHLLTSEATRRGDTLTALARALGVSYERVAQWRRGEGDISRASRGVHEAAASYLALTTAHVLCMAGVVRASDFVVPNSPPAGNRIERELSILKEDPAFAAFVPESLWTADTAVQWFVMLLYREVAGGYPTSKVHLEWFNALQLTVLTATPLESRRPLS
jgi:hypothetical protein